MRVRDLVSVAQSQSLQVPVLGAQETSAWTVSEAVPPGPVHSSVKSEVVAADCVSVPLAGSFDPDHLSDEMATQDVASETVQLIISVSPLKRRSGPVEPLIAKEMLGGAFKTVISVQGPQLFSSFVSVMTPPPNDSDRIASAQARIEYVPAKEKVWETDTGALPPVPRTGTIEDGRSVTVPVPPGPEAT